MPSRGGVPMAALSASRWAYAHCLANQITLGHACPLEQRCLLAFPMDLCPCRFFPPRGLTQDKRQKALASLLRHLQVPIPGKTGCGLRATGATTRGGLDSREVRPSCHSLEQAPVVRLDSLRQFRVAREWECAGGSGLPVQGCSRMGVRGWAAPVPMRVSPPANPANGNQVTVHR